MQNLIDYLTTRKHRDRVGDALEAIHALKAVQHSRQPPNDDQRLAMLKFPGFGSIASIFAGNETTQWEAEARLTLERLLTPEEYRSARSTILNQHQTDPRLIQLMWQTLQQFGFTGGTVFDPGCSVGWFGAFMPPELREQTQMVGVEIDGLSARLAKYLARQETPADKIYHRAIQEFAYPVASLDACLCNPPFGDGVFAPYNGMKFKIGLANWIVAKSIDLLRPGALMGCIVGTGVLDGVMVDRSYLRFREWLDTQAVFLGAVRLPQYTFKAIANTDTGADILLLQKRYSADDKRPSEPFIQVHPYHEICSHKTQIPVFLNEYFMKHPEHMVGKPTLCKCTGDRFATEWDFNQDLFAAIARALDDVVLMKEYLTAS